ncbi:MAG TPA: BamA/TamA family outer membrane protein [Vicinamibacterales bacterium]|nr:BamA/TamA family outer membrane protein [Vicinamibacterales bacterium]
MCSRVLVGCALMVAVMAAPAAAQETRAEILARQRAEKASQLQPYEPKRLEEALIWVERTNPLAKIAPYNGFYVQYGYTGKPVGSGIALGGGWRHDLLDRNARVVFEAGQSMRGYRMARVDFSLPRLLDERFEIGVEGAYRHQPQEDFYGLGFDTRRADRVNYRYRAPEVQGRAMFKPADWLNAGVRLGRMNVSIGPGTDGRFPSIEERFADADAPGLAAQPDYTYGDLFATLDTRDQPGNAREGAYIGVLWRRYNDQDLDRYSFHSVDLEAQHFLPIFDKKRVLAARFRMTATTAEDGQEVPFYFRPTIGGGDSLRSASDYRFRDRNAAVMNFEYRWEAFSGLDMALFSDFGTVAPRLAGLEFSRIRGAYGIGLRFNTYKAVWLRLDVAAGGSEGIRTFLKYSKAF